MKRKMLVAAAIATVALLTLYLAFPLFVAPATATSLPATAAGIQAVNNNLSEQQVQSLAWYDDWFNNNTRSFSGTLMGFNYANNFLSGNFTHRGIGNARFGLDFAKLVEFNDTNQDGYYNFNNTDDNITEYNLLSDINWINWALTLDFPNSIGINVTGHENSTPSKFSISFIITIFLTTKTITFNNTQVTIPAFAALKFGLEIKNYQWNTDFSTYPAANRYIALVIALHGSVGGSASHAFRWANGAAVTEMYGYVTTVPGTGDKQCEIYLVDSWGTAHAKLNWFNGANNTAGVFRRGNSSFNITGDTINIAVAFSYNDFQNNNLIIDPYFELIPPSLLPLILTLSLVQMEARQAFFTVLLIGGIAVAAVVLVGVAVVLARRRY